ncbi:MAG TPA: potassium transporter Kup [Gemmatimonadaceae bacterium]|nr:potassium transporter Kup [Gemmatimonadaceae bacterium]
MSTHPTARPTGRRLKQLTLVALGVVYGDIGTSPLYALRECFKPEYGLAAIPENVYGILSLVVWALILVVSVKYLIFILRADNSGEGGVLALLALILQTQQRAQDKVRKQIIIVLGLIGAALLYGDGVITPAISVLGAMEGLEVITPKLKFIVVPLTIVILFTLFLVQKKGTTKVGRIFGPVMALWFVTIAALGIYEVAMAPEILKSVNPIYALRFFETHGRPSFILLGAVVLVVTGGEALYADMGHFGARPIRIAWFALVLPALLLNYFGQGALILRDPAGAANPFFMLAPRVLLYPLVALATMAAIIASQALISGAFSLTQQAVQLGYSPRVNIVHTSSTEAGQIYIPEVNTALMIGCLFVVLGFRSSSALGAAYGIAVTGTMAITTILYYVLTRSRWNWSVLKAGSLCMFFLIIDVAFFSSNALKILHGGWVPIVIGLVIFTLMTTWYSGRRIVLKLLTRASLPIEMLLNSVAEHKPVRVPGTAVFMTSDPDGAPLVLLHHLKHNKVLHEQVVLLSVLSANVPEIPESERLSVTPMREGFWRVKARYGFMETASVPDLLTRSREHGLVTEHSKTTYYLGRERLIPDPNSKQHLAGWRKKLFIFMSRNSRSATEFFQIPPNRVVELGAQIIF